MALEGNNLRYLASLAYIYGVVGKRRNASELLGKIRHIMARRHVPAYLLAICYVGLGEKDQALDWLVRTCEENSAESPFVSADPRLAALRPDPRFHALLHRLGLLEEGT